MTKTKTKGIPFKDTNLKWATTCIDCNSATGGRCPKHPDRMTKKTNHSSLAGEAGKQGNELGKPPLPSLEEIDKMISPIKYPTNLEKLKEVYETTGDNRMFGLQGACQAILKDKPIKIAEDFKTHGETKYAKGYNQALTDWEKIIMGGIK